MCISDAGTLASHGKVPARFTAQTLHDVRSIFDNVCSDFESRRVEFDGEDDRVHLLVNSPPKIAVAALVNSLMGVPSRLIRLKNYPSTSSCYESEPLGAPGSFAGRCSIRAIRPRPQGRSLSRV